MSFLPPELHTIAVESIAQVIENGNSLRKNLQKNNCVEKVSQDTLEVLNIIFQPDYAVDLTTTDATAIELPITTDVESVTPITLKVRTPLVDVEELDQATTRTLAKALQTAVLRCENDYIIDSIKPKVTNTIDGTVDPVNAVEDATYMAQDYYDVSNFVLMLNPADRTKFTGHSPEYNSIRKYVEGLGVNFIVSNKIDAGVGYVVPLISDAVILGQIYATDPKLLKDNINMAVALGMKERIAMVVKDADVMSKIQLVQ
jgi:hypothetical protein